MIYEAEEVLAATREYDVCVVGSGPSGLTVALELLHSGLSVCVAEGGGLKENNFFDQLKKVESPKLEIKHSSRVRAFGGTASKWSGYIAPLDTIDLIDRGEIHQGWPLAREEIYELLNSRGYRYGLPNLPLFHKDKDVVPGWESLRNLIPKTFLVQVPPINFARKFKYAFARKRFDLVLGAVVTSLESRRNGDLRSISSLILKSRTGKIGQITAKVYVLAAGCIENVRLLLNSKDENAVAIGNLHDQLGRGFMNHPKAYVGEVCLFSPLPLDHPMFKLHREGFQGYPGLRLKESLQLSEGLLNHNLRLEPRGSASILRRTLTSARKRLRSLFPDRMPALAQAGRLPARLVPQHERRAGQLRTATKAEVRCFLEMEPSPNNRIKLGKYQDQLGVPLPIVEYEVSERALTSLAVLLEQLAKELRDLNIGEFIPYQIPLADAVAVDASHHLGGTSMGRDPKKSVIDPDLRVHGIDNLFLAGGSCFPSGGNANPTLTMIALSIRLAEHLRRLLST